jgi:predicted Zn-dependent protease
MNPTANPPASPIAGAVDRAAALLASEPTQAERLAQDILKSAPNDPRAGLILGSARRRLGDPVSARAILEPLAKAYPRAANTQYELGLTLAALGETNAAIVALRQAVAVKPDLTDAWRALSDQLFAEGDVAGGDWAYAGHARASVRNPALKPAADAIFVGRLEEAEQRLREHIIAHPDSVAALHMLAHLFIGLNRADDAEVLLVNCLQLAPGLDAARFDLANALFQQQKGAQAIALVEGLLVREPNNPAYRNLLAACLGLVGDHERVCQIYLGLLATYPKQPQIWLNYGHALRTIGRSADALAAYKRCIELAPDTGDAYWGLANLKVASFSAEEVTAMQALLARNDLKPDDRLHLHYALGKALEDRRDYAASFEHYAAGAELRRAPFPYSADEMTAQKNASIKLLTRTFLAAHDGSGSRSDEPIFIVGLPRSGSTLIEQILASHSAVEGTMELPDIVLIARELAWPNGRIGEPKYPGVLADLDPAALAALGDRYIETTRIHRKLGRPFFIDKMPNNFQHFGLIQLILPKAKVIDARRHPLGSCFSAFKQLFGQGQNFTYDLTDLGRYYRDYVELMAHFDAVLPGRIHRVIYEDMVEDTEAQVRALLDYCGLPFEPACLKFYENDRAVKTVSSEQVRRPIFREGLDQWRNYEPWLGPLKDALGPALDSWRGSL